MPTVQPANLDARKEQDTEGQRILDHPVIVNRLMRFGLLLPGEVILGVEVVIVDIFAILFLEVTDFEHPPLAHLQVEVFKFPFFHGKKYSIKFRKEVEKNCTKGGATYAPPFVAIFRHFVKIILLIENDIEELVEQIGTCRTAEESKHYG